MSIDVNHKLVIARELIFDDNPKILFQKSYQLFVEGARAMLTSRSTKLPPSCCPAGDQAHENLCQCNWHVIISHL